MIPVVPALGGAEVALGIYTTFLIYRTCMRRAPAKPVRACILRKWRPVSHVTFEAPLRTSRFSLHSSHSTLHTSHSTLHTSHCTLPTPHFTLHTPHFTLHTPHFTVHTSRFKNTTKNSCCCVQEHDPRATPVQCQLSSKHFPHTSHCSLHTSHSTLHTCTSFQLVSSELFSSHFMSSHMSAKFFLAIYMSSEHSSNFLISPKLVSIHLGSSTHLAQSTPQWYLKKHLSPNLTSS